MLAWVTAAAGLALFGVCMCKVLFDVQAERDAQRQGTATRQMIKETIAIYERQFSR